MGWFSFPFTTSSSRSNKITPRDHAILQLKTQRDKLQQYRKRLTLVTARETAIAKTCLANNNRPAALLALRRKKYQESLLSKTDAQLAQLEQLTNDVEFALVQQSVLLGLQQGTAVLKAIHEEMGGLEAVERLMGEGEEARATQREIGEALAGRMSNAEEDEVEEELEALQRQQEGEERKLPAVPGTTVLGEGSLPSVPGVTKKEEDDESRVQRQKERARARRVALEA